MAGMPRRKARREAAEAAGLPVPPSNTPSLPLGFIPEWLIDSPENIAAAYNNRHEDAKRLTPELVSRFLHLIRSGAPIKDGIAGPGAATQCGVSAATVWNWVHTDPAFAAAYREARDASSDVLEDEMRAMLPTAAIRPDTVRALEFISGRLEWLAKVRNRDRYNPDNRTILTPGQGITFNIALAAPAAEHSGRVIDGEKLAPAPLPAEGGKVIDLVGDETHTLTIPAVVTSDPVEAQGAA